MTGRGVDQILPHPGDPELREAYATRATAYVGLAAKAHGQVRPPVDLSYIWGDALAVLQRHQPSASIVNLETSITTSRDFWPGKGVHYRMHPNNVGCLQAAHLDVCALANNHVLDFGPAGLMQTIDTLRRAGIGHAGAGHNLVEASRPARVELGEGRTLLVFALGSPSSGIPWDWAASTTRAGIWLLSEPTPVVADAIAAQARLLTRPGDLALVSIHWGSNWGEEIPEEHVAFAHRLVDGGIDVVHGHSSHHVRAIELYRGKPIFYGCGDLVTDYEGIAPPPRWRSDLGVMCLVTFSPSDGTLVGLRLHPMQMWRMQLRHADEHDRQWLTEALDRMSRPFGARFREDEDGSIVLEERLLADVPP